MNGLNLFTLVLDKNSYIICDIVKSEVEKVDLMEINYPLLFTEHSMITPEGIAKALEIKPFNPMSSESTFLVPINSFLSISKTNLTGKMLYYKNMLNLNQDRVNNIFIDRDSLTDEELSKYGIINKTNIVNNLNNILRLEQKNEELDR